MLSKDQQLAVLQQLTYSDSRKVKEARRGKKYVISKALFLQSFYGKTNKIKRELIDDFFTKIRETTYLIKMGQLKSLTGSTQNSMILQAGNEMSNVKLRPISPKLIK